MGRFIQFVRRLARVIGSWAIGRLLAFALWSLSWCGYDISLVPSGTNATLRISRNGDCVSVGKVDHSGGGGWLTLESKR